MGTYVFYDNELVDVAELGVDKLPQRLLLVPLRLCHRLKKKCKQNRGGDEKEEDDCQTRIENL